MLKREIQVKQEFFTGDDGREDEDTKFQELYCLKVNIVTLRELLLYKSLYYAKTNEAISLLVMQQPNPNVFYKSFLELNGSNFCIHMNALALLACSSLFSFLLSSSCCFIYNSLLGSVRYVFQVTCSVRFYRNMEWDGWKGKDG